MSKDSKRIEITCWKVGNDADWLQAVDSMEQAGLPKWNNQKFKPIKPAARTKGNACF